MFSCFVDLGGILLDRQALDPPFRTIDFSEEPAVRTVAFFLRRAWDALPPPDPAGSTAETQPLDLVSAQMIHKDNVWEFIRADSHRTTEERDADPTNPDKEDLETTWRRSVYLVYRHVFNDASDFLQGVNGTIGHFHYDRTETDPQSTHGTLVVRHGADGAKNITFPQNVLMLPVFMDVDTNVRGERLPTCTVGVDDKSVPYPLDVTKELGVWSEGQGSTMWFIRRDVPVVLKAENASEGGEEKTGVAAVFIYALLCLENDREAEEVEQNGAGSVEEVEEA